MSDLVGNPEDRFSRDCDVSLSKTETSEVSKKQGLPHNMIADRDIQHHLCQTNELDHEKTNILHM